MLERTSSPFHFAPLALIPLDHGLAAGHIGALQQHLSGIFPLEITTQRPRFEPAEAWHHERAQYDAGVLLELMATLPLPSSTRLLGLAMTDLFVPMLTYVLGYAQLRGRAAVISASRLDDRAYGLAESPERLRVRLQKEAVHEVGHLWGLTHCTALTCAMHSSTDVTEVDMKGDDLCSACRTAIPHRAPPESRDC